jgi:hypothetical protein
LTTLERFSFHVRGSVMEGGLYRHLVIDDDTAALVVDCCVNVLSTANHTLRNLVYPSLSLLLLTC